MDQKPTFSSDLRKLEQAVPRKRLLAYAAILALVPAVVVWAMLMKSDRKQEGETSRPGEEATGAVVEPATGAPTAQPQGTAPSTGSAAGVTTPFAAPTTEWRTAVSPDGMFQVSLPPGTKLTQSEGITYVMADPTPRGALPIMAIKQPSAPDKQGYKPGTSTSVMLKVGTQDWWLYTWQFKEWTHFDRVVSSFKVL